MDYGLILDLYTKIPEALIDMFLAVTFCSVIGIERALKHKAASIKTFPLIGLASCCFTILSMELSILHTTDPTRIAAQIVSGVGFASAGIIFKASNKVEGVTTAVLVWLAAAVGMSCGFHREEYALYAIILYIWVLVLSRITHHIVDGLAGPGERKDD